MKLRINRNTWKSGSCGEGSTMLLNRQGYQCCLGQVCSQLGVPDDRLLYLTGPSHMLGRAYELEARKKLPEGTLEDIYQKISEVLRLPPLEEHGFLRWDGNSELVQEAIRLNDHPSAINPDYPIDRRTREEWLIELFAKHGHELEFYDGPGPSV